MLHDYALPLTLMLHSTVILFKTISIYFIQSYFHLFLHYFSELFHGGQIENPWSNTHREQRMINIREQRMINILQLHRSPHALSADVNN